VEIRHDLGGRRDRVRTGDANREAVEKITARNASVHPQVSVRGSFRHPASSQSSAVLGFKFLETPPKSTARANPGALEALTTLHFLCFHSRAVVLDAAGGRVSDGTHAHLGSPCCQDPTPPEHVRASSSHRDDPISTNGNWRPPRV